MRDPQGQRLGDRLAHTQVVEGLGVRDYAAAFQRWWQDFVARLERTPGKPRRLPVKVERRDWLAYVLLGCAACGGAPTAPDPVSSSGLLATPTSVVVEGKTITLGALIWRDFLPPASSPDGGPMIALVRVQTDDGLPVPATMTADMVWLVRGAEVWSAVPREVRARDAGTSGFEIVVRDGPKWEVGTAVDVIVQLRTRAGVVRVRETNQAVGAAF